MTDTEREAKIEALRQVMVKAKSPSRRRMACYEMLAEIHRRSDAQVAKMEAEKGLGAKRAAA